MSIEAMKQALEALEYADACLKKQLTTKTKHGHAQDLLMDAGVALRAAIETYEKPVAWRHEKFYEGSSGWFYADWHSEGLNPPSAQLLYTAPPAAPVQEPVRLQCIHCGTVYADGVPPAVLAPVQEPVAWESILGAVARGWCYEENANKTMDSDLAVAIAKEMQALYTTPQPQRDTWKNAAIRLGEELSSVGPDGYYNMTAEQWLDWAMDQQPRGKNSLPQPQRDEAPAKAVEWVGLTDEQYREIADQVIATLEDRKGVIDLCFEQELVDEIMLEVTETIKTATEAKLKEKNT